MEFDDSKIFLPESNRNLMMIKMCPQPWLISPFATEKNDGGKIHDTSKIFVQEDKLSSYTLTCGSIFDSILAPSVSS